MTNSTFNFKQLLKESFDGQFSVATVQGRLRNEILVNYGKMEIHVKKYPIAVELCEAEEHDVYFSLHGMFGKPTIEQKFYELVKSLS